MNKKLRKLIRSPRLFFSDFWLKRAARSRPAALVAVDSRPAAGHAQYSVVSAVYNVGRYLEEYFDSLVNQKLDFKRHLQLVLVDDGSTDDSAAIIQRWQARFPDNIVYVHKENGGQASARNLGLEHACREWVTFIDPDDFVDRNYFLELDRFVERHRKSNLQMVACNLIFYFDETRQFKDTHPLKYKYAAGDKVFPCDNLERHIQLPVHSAIFRRSLLAEYGIAFDDRVKPNFEDGLFIAQYLAVIDSGSVGFAPRAKYYYRKRGDGTSTLDTAWAHPGRLTAVFEHGYLGAFEAHLLNRGNVPRHIQRTVLYDILWIVKYYMGSRKHSRTVPADVRDRAWATLRRIFAYIDVETIFSFELAGCWFLHKAGMLAAFKDTETPVQFAYIEKFDAVKQQVLIRAFTRSDDPLVCLRIDGEEMVPDVVKHRSITMLEHHFVWEHRYWVHIPAQARALTAMIDGKPANVTLGGKSAASISADAIRAHFGARSRRTALARRYRGAWLLMDRRTQADDNAEHLYRHLMRTHPERNSYFVLDRDAADWDRLAAEGFRLLAFDSPEHHLAARCASKLISSHMNAYISDFLDSDKRPPYHLVFLQHGITQSDLSDWLNAKRIDCMITATPLEYDAITGPGTWALTTKEVVLTGFPRHDVLIRGSRSGAAPRDLVVMPTWRHHLLPQAADGSIDPVLGDALLESEYIACWMDLLQFDALKALAQAHGLRLVFFPHANLAPFVARLPIPAHVTIASHASGSIQDVFRRTRVLVTDYSSVAYEVAMLGRPTVYYQFDREAYFSGAHTTAPGHFAFERDGFGPVVESLEGVLAGCRELLQPDSDALRVARERIALTFPAPDTTACERVTAAIEALDAPRPADFLAVDVLADFARRASECGDAELAVTRHVRLAAVRALDEAETTRWAQALDACCAQWLQAATPSAANAQRAMEALGEWMRMPGAEDHPLTSSLLAHLLKVAATHGEARTLLELHRHRLGNDPRATFSLARLLCADARFGEAWALLNSRHAPPPATAAECRLRADLAAAQGLWPQAAEAILQMRVRFPSEAPKDALECAVAMTRMGLDNTVQPAPVHTLRHAKAEARELLPPTPRRLRGFDSAPDCMPASPVVLEEA